MGIRRGDGHFQRFERVFAWDQGRPLLLDGVEEILKLPLQRLLFAYVELLCVVLQRDLVEVERIQGAEGARADGDRLLRVVDLDEVLETGQSELPYFHRSEPVHLDKPVDSILKSQEDVRVVLERRMDLPAAEREDAFHRCADEVAEDIDLVDAESHDDPDVPDAARERTHAAGRRGHEVAGLSVLEIALQHRDGGSVWVAVS